MKYLSDPVAASIVQQISGALPLLRRGEWISFAIEGRGYTLRLRWNKNCDTIILSGTVEPGRE